MIRTIASSCFRPFQIIAAVGTVAYKLQLPADCRLHDVFHVSLLKPFKGVPPSQVPQLPPLADGKVILQPLHVLNKRLNRGQLEVLVHWEGHAAADATWLSVDEFQTSFRDYKLEGKLDPEVGSDVVDAFVGKTYTRKKTPAQPGDEARRSHAVG